MIVDPVVEAYLSNEQCFYEALQHATGIKRRIANSLRNTNNRYRRRYQYSKNGRKRPLSTPHRRLRILQDFLQNKILRHLDFHEAAHGYRKQHSILTAVDRHKAPAVLVCLDAQHFFTSISQEAVTACLRNQGACVAIASLIAAVCTDQAILPQGTPTSPSLSNAVAYPLDLKCTQVAEEHGFRYSRYADDLIFSAATNKTREEMTLFLDASCGAVREGGYGIQTEKFCLVKTHQRQEALGLVLNAAGEEGKPCSIPVRVKRKLKRRLRAALHKVETEGTAEWNASQIQGALSFIKMVEGEGVYNAYLQTG